MKKKIKRGFTIVELVIVIAVIGVLSAILIPTFSGLIKSAREASDISMVKNLNTALATDEVLNGKHETAYDAIKLANETGYIVEKLTPTSHNFEVVWDRTTDRFVLIDESGKIKYYDQSTTPSDPSENKYDLWKIYDKVPETNEGYSIYLAGEVTGPVTVTGVGLDVGENTGITDITYRGVDKAVKVAIRTNSASTNLTIDAYVSDTESDTIYHYDVAGKATLINAGMNSYHENGKVAYVELQHGKVVIENNAEIQVLYATTSDVAVIENGGNIENAYATSDINSENTANGGNVQIAVLTADEIKEIADKTVQDAIENETIKNDVVIDLADGGLWMSLADFRDFVNARKTYDGCTVTLKRDVDLSGIEWTPIGSKEEKIYFCGTFDGSGYTISGLNIGSGDYVGLFGAIKDATVKNLTVKGSVGGENGAGIVARMESGTIENCNSYVNVISSAKAGGIVCLTNNGGCTVKNCFNYGNVNGGATGTTGGVGGIVAYANPNTVISDCENHGVIGTTADTRAGGIVGYGCTAGSSVSNCVNHGEIFGSSNAGGIVAITTGAWNIENCTNNGKISSNSISGGIIGSMQEGKVERCSNSAAVSGNIAGGVVGVTGGAPEIILCSGGTAEILTPAQRLGFTGQTLVIELAENDFAGRLIGANGGGGQNAWTKLTIDDTNGDDTSIRAIGLCGPYTTWANLEIVSGTLYGDPMAGNTTYIKLDEGAVWNDREPGTYICGGVTEASRKTE